MWTGMIMGGDAVGGVHMGGDCMGGASMSGVHVGVAFFLLEYCLFFL